MLVLESLAPNEVGEPTRKGSSLEISTCHAKTISSASSVVPPIFADLEAPNSTRQWPWPLRSSVERGASASAKVSQYLSCTYFIQRPGKRETGAEEHRDRTIVPHTHSHPTSTQTTWRPTQRWRVQELESPTQPVRTRVFSTPSLPVPPRSAPSTVAEQLTSEMSCILNPAFEKARHKILPRSLAQPSAGQGARLCHGPVDCVQGEDGLNGVLRRSSGAQPPPTYDYDQRDQRHCPVKAELICSKATSR